MSLFSLNIINWVTGTIKLPSFEIALTSIGYGPKQDSCWFSVVE